MKGLHGSVRPVFQFKFQSVLLLPILFFIFVFISTNASAHARWSLNGLVKPRTTATGLKEPAPCGGVARTATPVVLKSGDTVVVDFEETINHPGYFRIAFSPAGDQGFDQNILVDNITEVPATRIYPQTITLPDIECDDCTLQLIQVMEDRNPPTNYYSCADIQLTATGTLPPPGGNDVTPPDDVTGLNVFAGDTQAGLNWVNPVSDFFQVLVLQKTVSVSEIPVDTMNYLAGDMIGNATVVYVGNSAATVVNNLVNGSDYYFKVFAYDNSINYSAGTEVSVTLPASPVNRAPLVSLIAEQSQQVTTIIDPDSGNVILQVSVDDPDLADTHSYNWSATDSRLLDVDFSESNFTFSPAGLAAGDYVVRVEVTDDGSPAQSASALMTLTIMGNQGSSNTGAQNNASSGGSGSVTTVFLLIMLMSWVWRVHKSRRLCWRV